MQCAVIADDGVNHSTIINSEVSSYHNWDFSQPSDLTTALHVNCNTIINSKASTYKPHMRYQANSSLFT